MKLRGKTFCCFGLRRTGKSTLMYYIASKYRDKAIVYDTVGELSDGAICHSYVPVDNYHVPELESFIDAVIRSGRYDMILIDEANRFCPSKPSPLPGKVAWLNDQCAHLGKGKGIGVGYIARRPSQLNQDLTELADYLFVFRLTGRNDMKFFEDTSEGLSKAVGKLKDYEFIVVDPSRRWKLYKPIPKGEVLSYTAKPNYDRGKHT